MADTTLTLPVRPSGKLLRALRKPATAFGLMLVLAHLFLAIFAPLLTPYGASELVGGPLEPPSGTFWLGTDQVGRDYLTRLIAGGQVALVVAFGGVAIAVSAGAALGLAAGYRGGWLDEVIMRLVDTLMSIPELILIAILTLTFGKDTFALIGIVAVVYMSGVVRVARARAVMLSTLDFVRAAEMRGESSLSILWRELLPNTVPLLGVELAVRTSSAVLKISALSFLGLGISQPTPDWGLMVQDAMGVVFTDPWFLLFPALMLSSLIIGINFLVDGLARSFGISTTELG